MVPEPYQGSRPSSVVSGSEIKRCPTSQLFEVSCVEKVWFKWERQTLLVIRVLLKCTLVLDWVGPFILCTPVTPLDRSSSGFVSVVPFRPRAFSTQCCPVGSQEKVKEFYRRLAENICVRRCQVCSSTDKGLGWEITGSPR